VVVKKSGEMTDLRTITLKRLEQAPLDVFALREDLNVDFDQLAKELSILLEAGYILKTNSLFYLTDRGRQYLKVEPQ
jgi:predicted transcriptional regulator